MTLPKFFIPDYSYSFLRFDDQIVNERYCGISNSGPVDNNIITKCSYSIKYKRDYKDLPW